MRLHVCVCVYLRVRVCVCACVRACVYAWFWGNRWNGWTKKKKIWYYRYSQRISSLSIVNIKEHVKSITKFNLGVHNASSTLPFSLRTSTETNQLKRSSLHLKSLRRLSALTAATSQETTESNNHRGHYRWQKTHPPGDTRSWGLLVPRCTLV